MSSGKGEKQSEVRKGGEKNPVTNKGVQRNCGSIPGRSDCRHVRLAFLRGKLSNLSAAVTNGSYRAEVSMFSKKTESASKNQIWLGPALYVPSGKR